MSGYKNFAIAGTGTVGSFIIDELLKQKAAGAVQSIVVLTRSAAGNQALAAKGVTPIIVDYNSPASLQSALQGIDVLISTLGAPAFTVQGVLGDAAKAAGVQLFVPSEFGGDTSGSTEGLFAVKNAQRLRLEEIGLPTAVFFTGPFGDWIVQQPYFGFDLEHGKVSLGGPGDKLVSFSNTKDIARYVVHVLLTLPPAKLHNHVFRIQSERTTFNKILEEYQARTGKKLDITRIPIAELEANVKKDPTDFKSFLFLHLDGHGRTHGREEEMNADWPEFKPEKVVDALLA